jgi:hypothetical protein
MRTLSAPCPHCRHDKSLFNVVWASPFSKNNQVWQVYLLCVHCGKGIGSLLGWARQATPQSPLDAQGNLDGDFHVLQVWPAPTPLVAPDHTPPLVAKRFLEGEDAFARSNWNSAVAMYRSALDIATKTMPGVQSGLTFFNRLEWMFANGKITQDIKEWADAVRVEGNGALHEPDEFDAHDAAALRFFTEMFLRYVFELPGKVAAFRAKPNTA